MKSIIKKLTILSSTFLMASCVGLFVENDYDTWQELSYEIESQVRGLQNIPYKGIMIIYQGPWAWSNPEFRITIDERKQPFVEFIQLEEHSVTQAMNMWDAGVRTFENKNKQIKMERFAVSSKSCSHIKNFSEHIWNEVKKAASNFEPVESRKIMLDGGATYTFYLADGDYHNISYSVVEEDNALVVDTLEFIEATKRCINNS